MSGTSTSHTVYMPVVFVVSSLHDRLGRNPKAKQFTTLAAAEAAAEILNSTNDQPYIWHVHPQVLYTISVSST
jgi:hypothetical protein